MLYVPAIVFLFGTRGPDPGTATVVVGALLLLAVAGVAIHVALSPEPAFRVLMLAVVTVALTAAAAFGVFFLVLVGGSCSDDGHIPVVAWLGGLVIYLVGGAVGLRRAAHGVWAVPASLLVGGIWLVGVATVLTGSTGACLD
jgi:hypothetical protein